MIITRCCRSFRRVCISGLLLIGVGFGPVFPAVIHSVPRRFGAAYSADLTGYHMGGAYGFGYMMQMVFGYVAVLTGYEVLPFVLLVLIGGVFALHAVTERAMKKSRS